MDGWKTSFRLGRPIFRCYVSFREGIHPFFFEIYINPFWSFSRGERHSFSTQPIKKLLQGEVAQLRAESQAEMEMSTFGP